jgi:hypothetical protein
MRVRIALRMIVGTLLLLLCALALLENVRWGAAYSAIEGLPSRLRDAEFARHRAQLFGWAAVALEGVAVAALGPIVPLSAADRLPRLAALLRYGIATAICLPATGVILWLVVETVRGFRLA